LDGKSTKTVEYYEVLISPAKLLIKAAFNSSPERPSPNSIIILVTAASVLMSPPPSTPIRFKSTLVS